MYAIFDVNGKQHQVKEGEVVRIDLMDKQAGDSVEFDQVLFISTDKEKKIGTPTIEGSKVVGEVLGDIKDKKIISADLK